MTKKSVQILIAISLTLLLLGVVLLPGLLSTPLLHAARLNRPQLVPGDCFVTNTNDSGANSLRACILGLQSGATITFSLTTFPPATPTTIAPLSALPAIITNNITIDASNAGVILSGINLGLVDGLVVDDARGVVIKGLQIVDFPGSGIRLQNGAGKNTSRGPNNLANSTCSGDCNLLNSNLSGGILVTGSGTASNTIVGNTIGTNIAGSAAAFNDDFGIEIAAGAQSNVISGNLISGNQGPGVHLTGSGANQNQIINNHIGANRNGTTFVANLRGVVIENGAQSSLIDNNLISGNKFEGVSIAGTNTLSAVIINNFIGTNFNGTSPIDNQTGIVVNNSAKFNQIIDNLISGNINSGIAINGSGTISNTIIGNKIGTDLSGNVAIANNNTGILIDGNAQNNLINENL
ncbi:MAG: hypothetical protein GY869_21580, partial [Planctomycetes bacterium]|nr:hypothetical protein [Planctomycetota bacterium]